MVYLFFQKDSLAYQENESLSTYACCIWQKKEKFTDLLQNSLLNVRAGQKGVPIRVILQSPPSQPHAQNQGEK